ncbi:7027_t:CDS:2 [Entrophospora sp. SA101]|nr:7027_t:CDS:2 [Entrophospora sp. SA101]
MRKENNPLFDNGEQAPLKALIFDLLYNQYRGVIIYVRIFEGELRVKQKIKLFNTQVGDTIVDVNAENPTPLPGYQKLKPNIYSNLYPDDSSEFNEFKKALLELQLQDSSLTLENIESNILGPGYCCGFLGLLHREIVQERIRQEYDLELILTAPTVNYRLVLRTWLETKYPYCVHAEANAVISAKQNCQGFILYTTLFPCHECAKLIIQTDNEYQNRWCCPLQGDVFRLFQEISLSQIKVVLLGQDPYHQKNVADGIAFSTQKPNYIPATLQNIFWELSHDLGCPSPTNSNLLP